MRKWEKGKGKKAQSFPLPKKGRILIGLYFHEDSRLPGQMADAAAGAEVEIGAEYLTQTVCGCEYLWGI